MDLFINNRNQQIFNIFMYKIFGFDYKHSQLVKGDGLAITRRLRRISDSKVAIILD